MEYGKEGGRPKIIGACTNTGDTIIHFPAQVVVEDMPDKKPGCLVNTQDKGGRRKTPVQASQEF
jgi:hypothetical protein